MRDDLLSQDYSFPSSMVGIALKCTSCGSVASGGISAPSSSADSKTRSSSRREGGLEFKNPETVCVCP